MGQFVGYFGGPGLGRNPVSRELTGCCGAKDQKPGEGATNASLQLIHAERGQVYIGDI